MAEPDTSQPRTAAEAAVILNQPRVRGIAPRVVGGAFALCAFAVAIAAGLAAENPTSHILGRALVVMLICHPVGAIVGTIIDRTIEREVDDDLKIPSADEPVSASELGMTDQVEITEVDTGS